MAGTAEEGEAEARWEETIDSVRHPGEMGEALNDGLGNFAEMESNFEIAGGVTAKEVKAGGLERDSREWKSEP